MLNHSRHSLYQAGRSFAKILFLKESYKNKLFFLYIKGDVCYSYERQTS